MGRLWDSVETLFFFQKGLLSGSNHHMEEKKSNMWNGHQRKLLNFSTSFAITTQADQTSQERVMWFITSCPSVKRLYAIGSQNWPKLIKKVWFFWTVLHGFLQQNAVDEGFRHRLGLESLCVKSSWHLLDPFCLQCGAPLTSYVLLCATLRYQMDIIKKTKYWQNNLPEVDYNGNRVSNICFPQPPETRKPQNTILAVHIQKMAISPGIKQGRNGSFSKCHRKRMGCPYWTSLSFHETNIPHTYQYLFYSLCDSIS